MEAKINPTRTQKRIQKRMKISLILEKEFGSETWDSFDFKHQNELISARIAENRKNKNKLRAEKQKQKRFSIAKELKKKIGASAWKNLSPEEREKKIDIEISDRKESAKKERRLMKELSAKVRGQSKTSALELCDDLVKAYPGKWNSMKIVKTKVIPKKGE